MFLFDIAKEAVLKCVSLDLEHPIPERNEVCGIVNMLRNFHYLMFIFFFELYTSSKHEHITFSFHVKSVK